MKKQERYIVVDDDVTNNLICEFNIKSFDDTVSIELYTQPEKALESIKEYDKTLKYSHTILFLDLNMPTMTGWEFLEEFEKICENIREHFSIYILTSSIEDFDQEAANFPFVRGFYSKPLSKNYLKEISKSFVSNNI